MIVAYFLYGFVSAFVLVVIVLSVVYGQLKRYRARRANIKGYLDLIPDLTEQQRAQVQEIRKVFLPKVEGIRQNMRRKRVVLAEFLFAEPTNRAGIDAIAEEIIGHQSELENEVIEHILEEKELLSVSQRRKFYAIIVEQFTSGGLGVHDVRAGKRNSS